METDKKYQKLISRIAANIKRVRESKGLTQEEMTKFGFNYRHYQKVESGRHSINLYTLYRLAEHFDVEIQAFFK